MFKHFFAASLIAISLGFVRFGLGEPVTIAHVLMVVFSLALGIPHDDRR